MLKQTFYGFKMYARVSWPRVITRFCVVPASVHELRVLPELAEGTSGLPVGDCNYHSPKVKEQMAREGVELLAPFSSNSFGRGRRTG